MGGGLRRGAGACYAVAQAEGQAFATVANRRGGREGGEAAGLENA
jgi:hypothetical protein